MLNEDLTVIEVSNDGDVLYKKCFEYRENVLYLYKEQ